MAMRLNGRNMEPTGGNNLDFGVVFNRGWDAFAQNIGQAVLFALLYLAGIIVASLPLLFILWGTLFSLFFAAVSGPDAGEAVALSALSNALFLLAVLALALAVLLLGWSAGLYYVLRKLASGQAPEFGDMFTQFPKLGQLIVFALVYGLAVLVGCLFLLLPGIFLAVMWSQGLFLIIDKGLDPFSAMAASWKRVWEDFWVVLAILAVLALISFGAGIIGAAIPFLGSVAQIIIVQPFLILLSWSLYDALFPPAPVAAGGPPSSGLAPGCPHPSHAAPSHEGEYKTIDL